MSAGSAVVRFFVLVFAVSLMCFPACTLDDGVYFGSSIFTPSDSEIVPVDDGTQIIEHTPLWDLYFWKSKIMLFFDSLWNDTPYQHFIRTVVIPLVSAVLGIILFVVLFSRKNPDHLSPTAAKVLAFLEEHPVSTEPAIIRGVGKSRGAVSYQLHRLLFDGKIYSAEISVDWRFPFQKEKKEIL
ncbi:MAG: hypothetical protein IIX51_04160 [Methanocorpusculum sp.]|nr:hypothetical protein [Methanocorpusculum sp.]